MNKVRLLDTSIYYLMSQPCSACSNVTVYLVGEVANDVESYVFSSVFGACVLCFLGFFFGGGGGFSQFVFYTVVVVHSVDCMNRHVRHKCMLLYETTLFCSFKCDSKFREEVFGDVESCVLERGGIIDEAELLFFYIYFYTVMDVLSVDCACCRCWAGCTCR